MTMFFAVMGALILMNVLQMIGHVIVQRNLTRTIHQLSDKIMARNYREYIGMKREEEIDVSPTEEEETKGWYDH